jgi:hypothetical protein
MSENSNHEDQFEDSFFIDEILPENNQNESEVEFVPPIGQTARQYDLEMSKGYASGYKCIACNHEVTKYERRNNSIHHCPSGKVGRINDVFELAFDKGNCLQHPIEVN